MFKYWNAHTLSNHRDNRIRKSSSLLQLHTETLILKYLMDTILNKILRILKFLTWMHDSAVDGQEEHQVGTVTPNDSGDAAEGQQQ